MLPANAFLSTISYDLKASVRQTSDVAYPILLFVIISLLFPIVISNDANILTLIAPGVLWIAVLLANLLNLGQLFAQDYHDGLLEQFILGQLPLPLVVIAKLCVHWLLTSLPIIILSPIVAIMFGLNLAEMSVLLLTLILATPILTILFALLSALLLNNRQANFLLAILGLPLFIPVLIFSCGSVVLMHGGILPEQSIAWLAAILFMILPVAPWLISTALRLGMQN